jgi:streptogramin lyase
MFRSVLFRFLVGGLLLLGMFAPQHATAQTVELFVGSSGQGTNNVLRYNGTTGAFIDVFVPTGSGGLVNIVGLTFGPDGSLYVGDHGGSQVLRYDGATGAFLDAFVPRYYGGLQGPFGLTFGPDGNLYVTSVFTNSILRYNGVDGEFMDVFSSAAISTPHGITFGPDLNLYVSNFGSSQVLRYNGVTGLIIDAFAHAGSGGLSGPSGHTFGPDGNLYVSSWGTDEVKRYNGSTGAFIDTFVSAGSGGLNAPQGLAFGPDGNLYVASDVTHNVLRYNGTTGAFIDVFANGGILRNPTYLVFRVNSAFATVSGRVTLQAAVNQMQPLTFEFRPTNGGQPFQRTITLNANRTFSLSGIPRNTYNLWIKGAKWLASVTPVNAQNGDVNTVLVTLLAGDANNDNFCDVFDLDLLIQAFNSIPGDGNWDERADFNCDDSVDVFDLDLLIRNFNLEGEP